MDGLSFYFNEWVNIAARWIHVFAGILWVGQTYFFTWLDGRFSEMTSAGSANNESDNVWMVHSGGFYLVGKQKKPRLMPQKLHWFRWEAAITWLSGVLLLVTVYYMGGLMMGGRLEETTTILLGVGVLVISWPVYDTLWRSKLASNEMVGVAVSFVLLVGAVVLLTQLMEGRAAYIHVGALMGTLMTVNVWVRIIPAQRRMVAALHEGKEPNLLLGEHAKMRSKHNTFMAVPVVFIMISNHYPVVSYGGQWSWAILTAMILVGWGAAKLIRRA